MREILFRGKRVDNGEWVEGGYAVIPHPLTCFAEDPQDPEKICIVAENEHCLADWNMPRQMAMYEVYADTVGQFTGLCDKNGKKIFEGDIITLWGMMPKLNGEWVIAYSENCFDWYLHRRNISVPSYTFSEFNGFNYTSVIIGTVYDEETGK